MDKVESSGQKSLPACNDLRVRLSGGTDRVHPEWHDVQLKLTEPFVRVSVLRVKRRRGAA